MEKITNQHGDLIFISEVNLPNGGKKLEAYPGFILERGEGVHTHVLLDVEGVDIVEKDGDIYVRVTKPTRIDHEEHGIQTLEPGVYKKAIERVFDYEKMESRKVID